MINFSYKKMPLVISNRRKSTKTTRKKPDWKKENDVGRDNCIGQPNTIILIMTNGFWKLFEHTSIWTTFMSACDLWRGYRFFIWSKKKRASFNYDKLQARTTFLANTTNGYHHWHHCHCLACLYIFRYFIDVHRFEPHHQDPTWEWMDIRPKYERLKVYWIVNAIKIYNVLFDGHPTSTQHIMNGKVYLVWLKNQKNIVGSIEYKHIEYKPYRRIIK